MLVLCTAKPASLRSASPTSPLPGASCTHWLRSKWYFQLSASGASSVAPPYMYMAPAAIPDCDENRGGGDTTGVRSVHLPAGTSYAHVSEDAAPPLAPSTNPPKTNILPLCAEAACAKRGAGAASPPLGSWAQALCLRSYAHTSARLARPERPPKATSLSSTSAREKPSRGGRRAEPQGVAADHLPRDPTSPVLFSRDEFEARIRNNSFRRGLIKGWFDQLKSSGILSSPPAPSLEPVLSKPTLSKPTLSRLVVFGTRPRDDDDTVGGGYTPAGLEVVAPHHAVVLGRPKAAGEDELLLVAHGGGGVAGGRRLALGVHGLPLDGGEHNRLLLVEGHLRLGRQRGDVDGVPHRL
eukprot:384586-Pyramimonas_sp.AAC.2